MCTTETNTTSYHTVHSKVVVLGLQLNRMLVVPSDLCVTGEKKALVVHDPVEHLHREEGEKARLVSENELQMKRVFPSFHLLTTTAVRIRARLLFGIYN